MAGARVLYGFHAVAARLRREPASVSEVYVDERRRDQRMQSFLELAQSLGVRVMAVKPERLDGLAPGAHHQGVVARAEELGIARTLDEVLDVITGDPFFLVLDGITDPHNLGACLRVADGAGVHAVIVPKDRAASVNATVAKVASGAAEHMPYITVTNLARTLRELREHGVRIVGTSDDGAGELYACDLRGPLALVLGAEGSGMRRLTGELCDELVRIPMHGVVESLNVSVASAVCLYEALRQRTAPAPGTPAKP